MIEGEPIPLEITGPKPLTRSQKGDVYSAIYQHMVEGDRWPSEVIADRFGGDESRYLRQMADFHGVTLEQPMDFPTGIEPARPSEDHF